MCTDTALLVAARPVFRPPVRGPNPLFIHYTTPNLTDMGKLQSWASHFTYVRTRMITRVFSS